MKLNKTYLSIILTLVISVSCNQVKYHLARTLGDFSHFAESLFTDKPNENSRKDDEYYMVNKPPAKNFINDLEIFSKDSDDKKEFKIKDLMRYVITPENELDSLSSNGKLSYEVERLNKPVNELLKKKEDLAKKSINIPVPGTLDSIKAQEVIPIMGKVVKKQNLKPQPKIIKNDYLTNNETTVNKVEVNTQVKDSKISSLIEHNTPKPEHKNKELPVKKESKEDLLNDIFSDMD